MLSSHFPRASCNKFVYDFLCGCLGIVGGSRLWRMSSHCLRASCNILYGPSGASRSKSVQRLRGDCTEIMQSQWSSCAVSAASRWLSYGARAASVQRLPGDGAVTVAPPCRFLACGLRAVPVRGSCDATYDMSTGYGLTIFLICIISR